MKVTARYETFPDGDVSVEIEAKPSALQTEVSHVTIRSVNRPKLQIIGKRYKDYASDREGRHRGRGLPHFVKAREGGFLGSIKAHRDPRQVVLQFYGVLFKNRHWLVVWHRCDGGECVFLPDDFIQRVG